MTAFKSGDPVRIKIDAEAVVTITNFGMGVVDVQIPGLDCELLNVPLAALVALPKPLAVGDVVTDAAQLDALPDGSVVCRAGVGSLPVHKNAQGAWRLGDLPMHPAVIASWRDTTVLRIGASL